MLSIDMRDAVKTNPTTYDCYTVQLFRLMFKADSENLVQLSRSYPIEAQMVYIYHNECVYKDKNRTEVDWDEIEKRATEKQMEEVE